MKKVSELQKKVLEELAEYYQDDEGPIHSMKFIAQETKLTVREVRLAVRALARKGYAELERAIDEDGRPHGSGYVATYEGALYVKACTACKTRLADMNDGTCEWCWKQKRNSNP